MNYTELSLDFNNIIHDAKEGRDLPNIKRRLAIVASKMETVAEALKRDETIIAQRMVDDMPVEVCADDIMKTVSLIDTIRRDMPDDAESIQNMAQRLYDCYVEVSKVLNDEKG